jgi:ribosomal protein S27E
MRSLTRKELDPMVAQGCQHPGCSSDAGHPLFLSAKCHPGHGVDALYGRDGELEIRCHVCAQMICKIAVKDANVN